MLEELGPSHLPVPNSFPQSKENQEYNYSFLVTTTEGIGSQENQPWTSGPAPDGKGQFNVKVAAPLGYVPDLGFGRADTFGEKEQSNGHASGMLQHGKDIVERVFKS